MDQLKAKELQHMVKQDCDGVRKSLVDLYSWEKEMKTKEKTMINSSGNFENQTKSSPLISPTLEKQDDPKEIFEEIDLNDKRSIVDEANEFKAAGNKCVKSQDYCEALEHYTRAIELVDSDPAYYSNRSLCHLKLQQYTECIKDCDRVIALDPTFIKAYFRKMQAYEATEFYVLALRYADEALRLDPDDASIQKAIDRINRNLKKICNKAGEVKGAVPWTNCGGHLKNIQFVSKPPHLRSKKPSLRIPIEQITPDKSGKNALNLNKQNNEISDEVIDNIFNNITGDGISSFDSNFFDSGSLFSPRPYVVPNSPYQPTTKPSPPKEPSPIPTKPSLQPLKLDNNNMKPSKSPSPTKEKEAIKQPPVKASLLSSELRLSDKVPSPPKSMAQFYTAWQSLNSEAKNKYLELMLGDDINIPKILGPSFEYEMMTEILDILNGHFVESGLPIAKIMHGIADTERFAINSMFLGSTEAEKIRKLVKYMEDSLESQDVIRNIKKKFAMAFKS